MINDQIAAIQSKLHNAENVPSTTKAELSRLLAELEAEIAILSETHGDEARKIALSTEASAGTLTDTKPEMMDAALEELRESVRGFETSHPKMTGIVGQLATTLSNMGI